jgi:hypothetical protein
MQEAFVSGILLHVIRWTARIASVLIAGVYLLLVFGEISSPHSGPPTQLVEWTGIALISVACLAPLAAWRRELTGAVASLAALLLFAALIQFREHYIHAIIATPGVLFLVDWALRRPAHPRSAH